MLTTLGIVLPGSISSQRSKVSRRLGGKTMLEWVVRRVTDSQRLSGVIVVLSDSAFDQWLAELVPADVPVFTGRQRDPLARVAAALDEFPAEAAVTVRATHPLVDPTLIDRLINSADGQPGVDYASYRASDGRPAILSPLGMFAEWFRAKALRRAAAEAIHAQDREQVTRYLYSHPEKFHVRLIQAPAELERGDLRLAVDSEEDWENIQAIYEALGPEHLDWQHIAGLLDHQPALRRRMAALNEHGHVVASKAR